MTTAGVGVDVGGQSVKAAIVSRDGTVLAHGAAPTGESTTIESLASSIVHLRDELSAKAGVDRPAVAGDGGGAIGVGLAGVIGRDGILRGSPHLPKLVGESVAERLSSCIGSRAVVHNDADCAAMAEGWTGGAADGREDFLLVTIGTGIGSGLVLGGRLRAGSSGYGCEFGHTTLVHGGRTCGCGNRGCLEAYISETAATKLAAESSASLQNTIRERRKERGGGAAQALFELGAEGTTEAETLAIAMVEALGAAIGSAVNLLDLTTIVLGGGIAPGVLARAERLRAAASSTLFARPVSSLELLAASRGPLAGSIGAARLALASDAGR